MKTINLLLANCDRRACNVIEAAVLDGCYNRAAVNCMRTNRLDELLDRGCRERPDLIILSPDNLLPEPSRRATPVTVEEVIRAIRAIRRQRAVPILGVNVSPTDELPLLEAGTDAVLGFPFDVESLKSEVRRVLSLAEVVERTEPSRWPFVALFARLAKV